MSKIPFFKNPAVKSMVSIAFYLVIIIGVWIAISAIAFPDAARGTDVKAVVKANEPLLTQLAEAASDDSLIEALRATDKVKELLNALDVTAVQPTDDGAAFILADGSKRLLYYGSGSYVFSPDDPDGWQSVSASQEGALRWEKGTSYVEAARLTEHFYLETAGQ